MKNSNWSDLLSWQFKKKTCLSSCLTVHSPAQYIPGNDKHRWSYSSVYHNHNHDNTTHFHHLIILLSLTIIATHFPAGIFSGTSNVSTTDTGPHLEGWFPVSWYDDDNWLTIIIYMIVTWTDPTLPPLVTRRIKRRIRGVVAWGAVAARGAWEWSWWLWSWFLWHRYYDHDHIDDNEENLDMECILSLPCSRLQGSEAGLGSSPMLSPWYFG